MNSKNLNIVNNIKRLMRSRRYNISKLAQLSGIQRVALSRTLSGKTDPRDDTLAKIAGVFGVTVDYLESDPSSHPKMEPKAFDYSSPDNTLSVEDFLDEITYDERKEKSEDLKEAIESLISKNSFPAFELIHSIRSAVSFMEWRMLDFARHMPPDGDSEKRAILIFSLSEKLKHFSLGELETLNTFVDGLKETSEGAARTTALDRKKLP